MKKMKKFSLVLVTVICSINLFAQQWAPVGENIKTPWVKDVDVKCPRPEYPRPQMVRGNWMNLNGLWNYGITSSDAQNFAPEGQILVPFAVESSLSGVGRNVGKDNALWYDRSFNLPKGWKGQDVLLHFGAVDWLAQVWVNGTYVGEHRGGYDPFHFNITPYLSSSAQQKITVKVWDGTDSSWLPRGKQVEKPAYIWYTPVTGIWQTVWLEAVPQTHVESYYVVSDIATGKLQVEVDAAALKLGDEFKVEVLEGGIGYNPAKPSSIILASAQGRGKLEVTVPDMKLWDTENPYLYGLKVSILRNGKVVDSVNGYTSLRKISTIKTADGYNRMALNDKALFQFGPLDQGWWPDGLYTAPTEEAMVWDIIKTKDFGYNMIRKHIKTEPASWYYWCDVHGMLVWQDMPCIADHHGYRSHKGNKFRNYGEDRWFDNRSEELAKAQTNEWSRDSFIGGTDCDVPFEWKQNFYREWTNIINALKGFQCIVVWVPFNEGWGQFDTKVASDLTHDLDPTRLVNAASGGNFEFCGDIQDVHKYPGPMMNAFERKMINAIGEYGGIGYPVDGHLWKITETNWGYGDVMSSGEQVLDLYETFADRLKELIGTGVAAAVYTQTTDVEVEVNGLITYDRKVVKIDENRMRQINQSVINHGNK